MKKKLKIFNYLLLLILMLIPLKANAISGSYSISSNSSVIKGNTISVTFNMKASNIFYWQSYITYDTSRLQLVSGSTNFQGTVGMDNGKDKISQTLKFKAKKAGKAWVKITPDSNKDYNINTSTEHINLSAALKYITVKEPAVVTYSSNNYLKSLSISGFTLSPTFKKDTLKYKVELPANTEKIKISAVKEDANAEISGAGTVKVTEGLNNITIKVTAENGNERKYIISANVKELDPIEVTMNDETYNVVRKKTLLPKTTAVCTDSTVKIKENDIPSYTCSQLNFTLIGLKDSSGNINLYVYNEEKETYIKYTELVFNKLTIIPLDDEFDAPRGYTKSTETINDVKITVYKKKRDSSYSLFYGTNIETSEKNIYLYDSKENTIQRFDNSNYNTSILSSENNNLYVYTTFGLIGILIVTYLTILICLANKSKKPKKIHLEYKKKK